MDFDLTYCVNCLTGVTRELQRGEILFREGDVGHSFFVVRSGRLRALQGVDDAKPRVVGEISAGELVGELAVLCEATRTATVVAVRHSVVVEVSGDDLSHLPADCLLGIMRILAGRMRHMLTGRPPRQRPHCITLVAASRATPLAEFSRALAAALARSGAPCNRIAQSDVPVEFSRAEPGADTNLSRWLSGLEERGGTLLLEADAEATEWTRRCLLQADLVLIVAPAGGEPQKGAAELMLERLVDHLTRPAVELVLLQEEMPYHGTARWLEARAVRWHHHVRLQVSSDVERLARVFLGAHVAFAFGGGGARGFAHIGVVAACEELGIPIDRAGGTSMGSVVGALVAMGLPAAAIQERLRAAFLPARKLVQWTLPIISIDTSLRYQHALNSLFGATQIEDLPLGYYCVSCNLTRAAVETHRRGPLSKWVSASISYPLIAPPLVEKGEMLVDGGLLNNVPVDIAKADGAGFAVGIDVAASDAFKLPESYYGRPGASEVLVSRLVNSIPARWRARRPDRAVFPTLIDLIGRTCLLSSTREQERIKQLADLYLRLPVDQFRLLEFDRIDAIAAAGRIGALTGLQPLVAWIKRRETSVAPPPAVLAVH